MKIAIASDDQRQVSQHFGRCRGFVIYELNGSRAERVEYRANGIACHDQGADPASAKVDRHGEKAQVFSDCGVVIAGGMGPGMREALKRASIQSIVTDQETVEGAVKTFMDGRLVDAANHECCHGQGDCGQGEHQ